MKKLLLRVLFWLLVFVFPVFAAEYTNSIHSTAYESSHIITTDPTKTLYWISITWQTAANRWLIIYNSKTVPADGALTTTKVLYCGIVSLGSDGSTGTKSFDWTAHPLTQGTGKLVPAGAQGMVAIISTDPNGCTTKAADGNDNWITAGYN